MYKLILVVLALAAVATAQYLASPYAYNGAYGYGAGYGAGYLGVRSYGVGAYPLAYGAGYSGYAAPLAYGGYSSYLYK